ncbi:MAG: rhodanese-like domain-containing protein [Myxococcales bacterium]|nr:rhodanese-like domain-containing protein [Myxococcales bacterium]
MSIACSELLRRLGDDDLLVIDCRRLEDWEGFELHIPGALRMSVEELHAFAHQLPDDELIVLVGWEPDGWDARQARRILRLGGREAVCLEGGLRGWVASGYPIERHEADAASR